MEAILEAPPGSLSAIITLQAVELEPSAGCLGGSCPIHVGTFQGERVPMILRLKDVRMAAKDTATYSSDAARRVPIPSEEEVRTVRQYPLEVDPPLHAEYRKIVEPLFLRPKQPDVLAKIHELPGSLVSKALDADCIDVVKYSSIPLQSHALTYLLNVAEKEAELWVSWGIHVFKDGDGKSKGPFMEKCRQQMFESAAVNPGDDFFSALNQAEVAGRPLTMEEKLGFANIAFAGGRDTIIHTASRIISYFAENPVALEWTLAERVSGMEILDAVECFEKETGYTRKIGYELLRVKFTRFEA